MNKKSIKATTSEKNQQQLESLISSDEETLETKKCRKCLEIKTLDNFSKHSGTADKLDNRCKLCVSNIQITAKANNVESKTYPVIKLDLNSREWQAGKRAGTIIKRDKGKLEARIKIDGRQRTKTCYSEKEAEEWLCQMSNEHNLTRNRIKVSSKTVILVELTQGYIMKTDLKFQDIVQKHTIVAGKGGGKNAEYYAIVSINSKNVFFHNLITGNTMTDHINRNTLDNRLANLREADHKLNNNNRGICKKYGNTEHIMGVRYVKKDDAYQARIKQNGNEITRNFSINLYGHDEAKRLATKARDEFCKNYGSNNK